RAAQRDYDTAMHVATVRRYVAEAADSASQAQADAAEAAKVAALARKASKEAAAHADRAIKLAAEADRYRQQAATSAAEAKASAEQAAASAATARNAAVSARESARAADASAAQATSSAQAARSSANWAQSLAVQARKSAAAAGEDAVKAAEASLEALEVYLDKQRSEAADAIPGSVRDWYFGREIEGEVRGRFTTGATAPGNGIVVLRLFIGDEYFYCPFAQPLCGKGDNRSFSDSYDATYRVIVAWDTETGQVTMTAAPSCFRFGYCSPPRKIGEGNNLEVVTGANGKLEVKVTAQSSVKGLPAIDQHIKVDLTGGRTRLSIDGDPYPDFEAVRFKGNSLNGDMLASGGRHSFGGPALQLNDWTGNRKMSWTDGFSDYHPAAELMRLKNEYCPIAPQMSGC
ncbi:hypothetical protein AB0C31_51150, partial [Actinoplanes philippinensis]